MDRGMPTKTPGHRSFPGLGLGTLFKLILIATIAAGLSLPAGSASANSRYGAIVIDAVSGEVLHQEHANRPLYPASLTKMMTLYMVFKALEDGSLTLDQRIGISRKAAGQAPSRLGLSPGSTIRVEDAIYALVTKSANDIATAVAEAIGGTEFQFAQQMTREARRLGMSNTTFQNASGLPHRRQVSTPLDMALLSQALIRNYPQYYHYFDTQRWSFNGRTYRNHNELLRSYDGMDGPEDRLYPRPPATILPPRRCADGCGWSPWCSADGPHAAATRAVASLLDSLRVEPGTAPDRPRQRAVLSAAAAASPDPRQRPGRAGKLRFRYAAAAAPAARGGRRDPHRHRPGHSTAAAAGTGRPHPAGRGHHSHR